jgi:hypothetical protein
MKRYCVVSGSRTGSSLLQYLMWPYLHRKYGYYKALGDAFMLRMWLYDSSWDIGKIRLTHMTEQNARILPISRGFEMDRRVSLLQKYHNQKYFMKMCPEVFLTCSGSHLDYIRENYHLIVIDRKNKRERALSHAIALISNFYTMRDKNDLVRFRHGQFTGEIGNIIADDFLNYHEARKTILDSRNCWSWDQIFYEDIVGYGDANVDMTAAIRQLGFNDWHQYTTPGEPIPFRISAHLNKRSYITNIDEFDRWFNTMEDTFDAFTSN